VLPPSGASETAEPGDVPTRAVEPRDDAAGDGIAHVRKDDWDRPRLPSDGNDRRGPVCHDDLGLQDDQLLRKRSSPIVVIAVPPKVHPHVAATGPTQVRKRLSRHERRKASGSHGMSTPMRRTRSPRWARAASGHAIGNVAATAASLMTSHRRLELAI
jgi:hypothetical protein